MITITWSIIQLNCATAIETKTNVVVSINWKAVAQDGEYTSQIQSIVNLPLPDGEFTEYNNLTESQVIQWTKDVLGAPTLAAIERNLTDQILFQKYPERISPPLPW